MTVLDTFISGVAAEVDDVLDRLIPSPETEPGRLHEAIRWSVFAGGKRIRPVILMAAGEACGATRGKLTRTAAAVEMIHAFSLIHDDLPAMDDDDLRRGRMTCHKKFDEATAILAGDALLVLAFETIAADDSLSADVRVNLVADIAAASGTPIGMVAGQQLDLLAEGSAVEIDQLETIHARKTGALIKGSARAGALIGGASDRDLQAIERFGSRLGLLFQITDDLLDITQSTEMLGKTAGKDLSSEKATYPALFGLERSRELAMEVFEQACTELEPLDRRKTAILIGIAEMILKRSR